jgi:hypothetical protein
LVSPNIHRSFHPHDDAPTAEIEVPAKPDLANTDLPMPAPASRRTAPKPCTGDDISRTTRVKDTDLDAGAWDTECGEFVSPVIPTTFESIHDIRSDTRVPAVVPDDTYVERDDTYQPDFSESEAYPWQG